MVRMAPLGYVWLCGACGKRERDRYGSGTGWDESCMLNSLLIPERFDDSQPLPPYQIRQKIPPVINPEGLAKALLDMLPMPSEVTEAFADSESEATRLAAMFNEASAADAQKWGGRQVDYYVVKP